MRESEGERSKRREVGRVRRWWVVNDWGRWGEREGGRERGRGGGGGGGREGGGGGWGGEGGGGEGGGGEGREREGEGGREKERGRERVREREREGEGEGERAVEGGERVVCVLRWTSGQQIELKKRMTIG